MKRTHLHNGIEMCIQVASRRLPKRDRTLDVIYSRISNSYPPAHSQRSFVTMLVDFYFSRAIELTSLGQFPSAYVEVHALLEESALRLLPKRVGTKGRPDIVAKLIERKTLSDIAPQYELLNLWLPSDVKFAQNLSKIRNGIVHRNFSLLAKHLGSSSGASEISELDRFKFSLEGTADTLATAIGLTTKIAKIYKRKRTKS